MTAVIERAVQTHFGFDVPTESQFTMTIRSNHLTRTILVDWFSYGPTVSTEHVYVEGVIVRKSSGTPGTYRAGGFVEVENLPRYVLERIVFRFIDGWHWSANQGWLWD